MPEYKIKLQIYIQLNIMQVSTQFYENHAAHFSDTRFCIWDVVREFGESRFTPNSVVLDVGCGNGKNMKYFNDKCSIYL